MGVYQGIAQSHGLNERELIILRAIVHLYVLHAIPVGSRVLSKYLERESPLSPATIRNVMSDLEERDFITHPHTSAGRIPTDKGYRLYVDALMEQVHPSKEETKRLVSDLALSPRDTLMRDASRLLGSLSHNLALVQLPQLANILVRKVEMFLVSSDKILVVLALESDIIQTLTIETHMSADSRSIEDVSRLINERIVDKPLSTIHLLFPEVLQESDQSLPMLVRLFVDHVGKLTMTGPTTVHMAGRTNLISHPEFEDPERLRSVIELVENEDVIIHVLGNSPADDVVQVRIGNELDNSTMLDYSMVSTTYRVGSAVGSVGLIGPKRMQYSRMMNLVQMVSIALSKNLSGR